MFLSNKGLIETVYLGEAVKNKFHFIYENLGKLDILVIQRSMAWHLPCQELRKLFRNKNTKVVFEFDDAFTHIPITHPEHSFYENNKTKFEEYLGNADLITVSTEYLKSLYSEYNKNIMVLPNCIDTQIWTKKTVPEKKGEQINILFSGTPTHEKDLSLVEDAFIEIMNEFGDRVNFIFWGNVTNNILQKIQPHAVKSFTPDYFEYIKKLHEINPDIGVIPLDDNIFNKAKSHIKWLEYCVSGITCICSDVEAYTSHVEHGKTGFLVKNTPDQWYQTLKVLINEAEYRKQIADHAYHEILKNHTIERHALKWVDAYDTLFQIL